MIELILGIMALAIIAALYYFLAIQRKNSSELFKQKRAIEDELKTAEANFFKRRIPETEYRRIVQEKQLEMIKIEVQINNEVNKQALSAEEKVSLDKIETKQRHILQELFEARKSLLKERDLIQQRYHKRKIDEILFKEMMNKNQAELIALESKIKSMAKEEIIDKTLADLKENTKQFKKEKDEEEKNALEDLLDQAIDDDET